MIRSEVENGNIIIKWIHSEDQLADVLTMPLTAPKHDNLIGHIMCN
mgnify:CR=1 FL=1